MVATRNGIGGGHLGGSRLMVAAMSGRISSGRSLPLVAARQLVGYKGQREWKKISLIGYFILVKITYNEHYRVILCNDEMASFY